VFASAENEDRINLYEIKGDLSLAEKMGEGYNISEEIFKGVYFNPVEKDYLIAVSQGGKAFLLKVNESDWSIENVHEIDLGIEEC
jgi:hypothetical protein